jgi:hypothetical protein
MALVVVGVVVLAGRNRRSTLSRAILGFAHSMDRTSLYAGSQRSPRETRRSLIAP